MVAAAAAAAVAAAATAAAANMSRLELLNVFVNDRLVAAGEEIVRAIKDALVEYQSEILRSKEENERLRRLLNVAVQRLLLQQTGEQQRTEPAPTVHPHDDGQPCEWRSSVVLLPQIKEEPNLRNIQMDCSHDTRDSEEGNCSHTETVQGSLPLPAETVCSRQSVSPPQLTSQEFKTEGDRKEHSSNSIASSLTDHTDCSLARSDSCSNAAKSHRTQKAEQQVKGLLCSNGKQSAHVMQIKNVRSLKPPLSRASHPSQSIQRWHSCKECGKGFSFACQLEVHMRWHTKEKPYSCTVCRKSFTTVSMLKRHHRIHTGEKPFRCHVCGKCFNQSAHLNTHFRLHTRERSSWSRVSHTK